MNLLLLLLALPALLVPQLGSRSFRTREAAYTALASYGEAARPALTVAQEHKDPEIRRRADLLLNRPEWVAEVAEAKSRRILPRNYPRMPWINETVAISWETEAYYKNKAGANETDRGADWPSYREATRLWVVSQILQKRPRREILDALDELAAAERNWIIAHGKTYTPPIPLPPGVEP